MPRNIATSAYDESLRRIRLITNRYICEISPPDQRGPLAAGPQLLVCFGLMVGFFICYGTARIDSSLAWRTPFIILASFAMIFVITSTLWLVPSPRWLILRDRHTEVSAAWDLLGVGHKDREKAENEIQGTGFRVQHNSRRQQDTSPQRTPDLTAGQSFFDAFSPDVRLRTGLAVFLLGMQQLSGIDGVLYVNSFKSIFVYVLHRH